MNDVITTFVFTFIEAIIFDYEIRRRNQAGKIWQRIR
jgi:hypothetical protein